MLKFPLVLTANSILLLLQVGAAQAAPISQAKAAELSLHRVEKLVILKKIEAGFQDQIEGLTVEAIAHTAPDQPSYRTVAAQWPASDGSQKKVEIILAEDGKPISFTVLPGGGDPANAPTWSGQDPTTLSENSLHYVLENAANDVKVAVFFQGLTRFSTSQGKAADGSTVAVVDMEASNSTNKLRVQVTLDGTFSSAEFIPLN